MELISAYGTKFTFSRPEWAIEFSGRLRGEREAHSEERGEVKGLLACSQIEEVEKVDCFSVTL